MRLRVYADRLSQPSRAVLIFCKVNGIDFEEINVDLLKREQFSPQFKEINPMRQVPAIVHGNLKLFESHAILRYLACAFPGVADHWYPSDLPRRAEIDSMLDWHHLNLRRGAAHYLMFTVFAPWFGRELNPQVAFQAEQIMYASLRRIELIFLKGNSRFLLGGSQPSIADLSLVCEIMQLEILDEKDRDRILSPYKKVQQWIKDTKLAIGPHFGELHKPLLEVKPMIQKRLILLLVKAAVTETSTKTAVRSNM